MLGRNTFEKLFAYCASCRAASQKKPRDGYVTGLYTHRTVLDRPHSVRKTHRQAQRRACSRIDSCEKSRRRIATRPPSPNARDTQDAGKAVRCASAGRSRTERHMLCVTFSGCHRRATLICSLAAVFVSLVHTSLLLPRSRVRRGRCGLSSLFSCTRPFYVHERE